MTALDDEARRLDALPLADFGAARDSRARELKAAGDDDLAREVKALRKPSRAAWILNMLVREEPDRVRELLALGADLRTAQDTLEGESLRALSGQRRAVVRVLALRARELSIDAGQPVSPAVAAEVEQTLDAALTDAEVGEMLISGRMVASVTAAGFGFGESSSPATTPKPASRSAKKSEPATESTPEPSGPTAEDVAAAKKRVRAAQQDASRAEKELVKAKAVLDAAHLQVAEAQRDLSVATEHEEQSTEALETAERSSATATAALVEAEAALEALRES